MKVDIESKTGWRMAWKELKELQVLGHCYAPCQA